MKTLAAAVLALILMPATKVEAGCVDPAALAPSIAGITRQLEGSAIRGTGWFLSSTLLVTVEHVTSAMELSEQQWNEVELRTNGSSRLVEARVDRIVGPHTEKIAVIELRTAVSNASVLPIRAEPLSSNQELSSIAYPNNTLRVAKGRFVDHAYDGMVRLEMSDGDDRLVLDHGASGAPVFDCDGRVTAVLSGLFTVTLKLFSQSVRTSTPWGSFNVMAVPISVMK